MQTKWVMDIGYKNGQLDKNINFRSTKYKAYQVNKILLNEYNKVKQ